jgi:hypothetical protein
MFHLPTVCTCYNTFTNFKKIASVPPDFLLAPQTLEMVVSCWPLLRGNYHIGIDLGMTDKSTPFE